MSKWKDVNQVVDLLLRGDRRMLSKTITGLESSLSSHKKHARQILLGLQAHQHAHKQYPRVIGVSGSPGVGKSSFIESYGLRRVKEGKKLAILAIDPSSTESKGSILGDITRMTHLSQEDAAYIRPSPNRGRMGGVASSTHETIALLSLLGYDEIMVETVGVGQSEILVRHMVDCFLLLVSPTMGDELQGIKKGIMEVADMIAITKCDGDGVRNGRSTAQSYQSALKYNPNRGWSVPVVMTSTHPDATHASGMDEIAYQMDSYFEAERMEGIDRDRRERSQKIMKIQIEEEGGRRLLSHPAFQPILASVENSLDIPAALQNVDRTLDQILKVRI